MGRYATKRYVNRRINETTWSSIQRVHIDFDNVVVNSNPGDLWSITGVIADNMKLVKQYTTYSYNTDNDETYTTEYKIEYIRIRLRCALGEDETVSATTQTVRVILWRSIESINENAGAVVTDVDGCPRYGVIYSDINGLWYDKWQYVRSLAADGDTTSGGQVFFSKKIRPLHSDTILFDGLFDPVDNEKGTVVMTVIGDNPTGVNASLYGYVEIGYVYKTD